MVSDTRRSKRLNLHGGQLKLSPDNHRTAVKFRGEWTVLPLKILNRRRSTCQCRCPFFFLRCSRDEDALNFHLRQKRWIRCTAADENGRGKKKRKEGERSKSRKVITQIREFDWTEASAREEKKNADWGTITGQDLTEKSWAPRYKFFS